MSISGFPNSLVGKEYACNAGDPDSIPGLGRSAGEGIPTPVFWLGELHGLCSPWGHKQLDKTEQLSHCEYIFLRNFMVAKQSGKDGAQ